MYTAHTGKLLGCLLAFFWAAPLLLSASQNSSIQGVVLCVFVTIFGAPRLSRINISRSANRQWKYKTAFKQLYLRMSFFLGILAVQEFLLLYQDNITEYFEIFDVEGYRQAISVSADLIFLIILASIRGMLPIRISPDYFQTKIPRPQNISICKMLRRLDFWRLFLVLVGCNAAFSSVSSLHLAAKADANTAELQIRWYAAALGGPIIGALSDALLPTVSRFAFAGLCCGLLFVATSMLHFWGQEQEGILLTAIVIISFCYSGVNVVVQIALLERFGAPAQNVGRKYALLSLGATLGCLPAALLVLPEEVLTPGSEKTWVYAAVAVICGTTCLLNLLRRPPKITAVFDADGLVDSILNRSFINKYAPPLGNVQSSFLVPAPVSQSFGKFDRFTQPLLLQSRSNLEGVVVVDDEPGSFRAAATSSYADRESGDSWLLSFHDDRNSAPYIAMDNNLSSTT
jgi:hypothetical protein